MGTNPTARELAIKVAQDIKRRKELEANPQNNKWAKIKLKLKLIADRYKRENKE